MFAFHLLLLLLSAASAYADLTCLEWGVISPIVGLICHFAPETYTEIENSTVAAVQAAVEDVSLLVQFDLSHHPAVIAYNYLTAPDPNAYLKDTANDFGAVTIGFGKETANQILQVVQMDTWMDVAYCAMKQGVKWAAAAAAPPKYKRAEAVTSHDAASNVWTVCLNPEVNGISSVPKVFFQIDDPNQRVGATISDIATLFIPVGPELEVGEAAAGSCDLAIRGSEDTSRIYRAPIEGEPPVAQHFNDEVEALSVADSLKDPEWKNRNCLSCDLPDPNPALLRRSRRRRDRLARRGSSLSICCFAPPRTAGNPFEGDLDTPKHTGETGGTIDPADPSDSWSSWPSSSNLPPPVYEPASYGVHILEEEVTASPEFRIWDVTSDDLPPEGLITDLESKNTGVAAWSPGLVATMDSEAMLTMFRDAFILPPDDPLYQALQIEGRVGEDDLRLTTVSETWMESTNPLLAPYQKFVNAAVDHGINIVGKLKGWTLEETANMRKEGKIAGIIEWFRTGKTDQALKGIDPRGLHVDGGMMQFGIADELGLVIANDIGSPEGGVSYSRVPLVENAFYCIKASDWDSANYWLGEPNTATRHSVFGPEMAKNGRVSMIMTIFNPEH